jgi:hypothetical protein
MNANISPPSQTKSEEDRFSEVIRAKSLIGQHLPEDYLPSISDLGIGSKNIAEALTERSGSVVLLNEAIALHGLWTVEKLIVDRLSRHSEGELQNTYSYSDVSRLFCEPCGPLTRLIALHHGGPLSLDESELSIVSKLCTKSPGLADLVAERLISEADFRLRLRATVGGLSEDMAIEVLSKGYSDSCHSAIDENVQAINIFAVSISGSSATSTRQLINIFQNSKRIADFNSLIELRENRANLDGAETQLSTLIEIAPNFVLESLARMAKGCDIRELLCGPSRTAIGKLPRLILDTIIKINNTYEKSLLGQIDQFESFKYLVSRFGQDDAERALRSFPHVFVSVNSPLSPKRIESVIAELGFLESCRMLKEQPVEFLYFCLATPGMCDPGILKDVLALVGAEKANLSPYQEKRVLGMFSNRKFFGDFERGIEKLGKTDCIRDGSLAHAFELDPLNTLIALSALGRVDGVEKYLTTGGHIDFGSLPIRYQLLFNNYEVAATFSIRNAMALLELGEDRVKNRTYHEGRKDPGLDAMNLPPRDEFLYPLITFSDHHEIVLARARDGSISGVNLPYSPLKFLSAATPAGGKTRDKLINDPRAVVIVASPSLCETLDVVEALKATRGGEQKSLTILALRQPSSALAEDLKNLGFKVGIRSEDDRNRGDSICEGKSFSDFDIVILNTRGELKDLFASADIAIVGEDRNLAEPIYSGSCPKILGFEGAWNVNRHAKKFAEETGRLTIVTSETIAQALGEALKKVDSRLQDGSAVEDFKAYLEPYSKALRLQYGWVIASAVMEYQDSRDNELAQLEEMAKL